VRALRRPFVFSDEALDVRVGRLASCNLDVEGVSAIEAKIAALRVSARRKSTMQPAAERGVFD
jgi:hypothetical protein